jgi:hypothetical protein
MVVYDLDLIGTLLGPEEADPVLIVDPDRVLFLSVAMELLQMEPWKRERLE